MKTKTQLNFNQSKSRKKPKRNSKYQKFNLLFLGTICVIMLAFGSINIFINPYGIFNTPVIAGVNKIKPKKFTQDLLLKAVEVSTIQPNVLFLGSSKEQWGLDTNYPAFSQENPYNLGLQAAGMYTVKRYFDHAIANQKDIKLVILGLDLFQFNEERDLTLPSFSEERLEKNHLTIADAVKIIFSVDVFEDSKKTWEINHKNPSAEFVSTGETNRFKLNYNVFEKGAIILNPKDKIPGTWKLFTQDMAREINKKVPYKLSEERLGYLQYIVDTCQEKGIDLKIFISPEHTTHLEGYIHRDLWQPWEEWKRELTKIAPIWDFSGYHNISNDTIDSNMKYYIDSLHYKKVVGNMMMDKMLSTEENLTASNTSNNISNNIPNNTLENIENDFGVLITPENIEQHLAKIRQQHQQWQLENPKLVESVSQLKVSKKK